LLKDVEELVGLPFEIFVAVGIANELGPGVYVAAPIGPEHGIDGKALVSFVVSKHAVPEKLVSFFDFLFLVFLSRLIVDDTDSRPDAGQ
jgi:hypothetical protein